MARIRKNDKVHVAWCVGGVIGCLVLYGVLQVRQLGGVCKTGLGSSLASIFGREVCWKEVFQLVKGVYTRG